jgi:serine/threonine protein phosphatase 1
MPSLRAFFGLGPKPVIPPLPRPTTPICVVGDLHGMAELLHAMLALIAAQPGGPTARIVFTGDIIDRGPASASVLTTLRHLCQTDPAHHICLMGNHERMLLDFLADPAKSGKRWIAAGGGETLISFDLIARISAPTPATRYTALANALRTALPDGLPEWLASLPLYWQEAGFAVVHAGADPALSLPDQSPTALLWGHHQFLTTPRPDGLWIAHGHTIAPEVSIANGRIAVDTGAYQTGILSALWLDNDGARVLTVG